MLAVGDCDTVQGLAIAPHDFFAPQSSTESKQGPHNIGLIWLQLELPFELQSESLG
jgi:hypothetical protein